MAIRRRISGKDGFELKPFMTFDDVKRNIGRLVEEVHRQDETVLIGRDEESPQFIIYPVDDFDDEIGHLKPIRPSTFAADTLCHTAILRFTGQPLLLGNDKVQAVIKLHPDWAAAHPILAEAREAFLHGAAEDRLGRIEAKVDELLALAKKND